MSIYDDIYAIVSDIPHGCVASYGRIARMAGCGPRQVGYAMSTIPMELDIPWHRVVNSQGKISARGPDSSESEQRQRLLEEGVVFKSSGKIDFDEFGWELDPFDFEADGWTECPTD